ncbi:MAG: cytochrome b N-terminal domain-containing protein [Planctomycetaceae bacterium]|nr:cytochrome b N-terminal domain-containing protein [Planctomycetaceae bacterium]
MITQLADWLDDRVGYRHLMHIMLKEPIRGGARWRYVWGSTLTFVFFLQMVTGFALWMGYSANAKNAWESVFYIQHEMTLGWLVRGIHHFAAQAMVVLLLFHLVQVVVDGAYRAPREINFWLGLILMQIVLGLGLTGYLLPWDQKGYYATQVATGIMGSTPVVGESVQKLMQGGAEYGHHTLTRFFALHAGLLPALLVGFLFLHIYVFRRHGLTIKEPHKKPVEDMFWPDQILKDAVACLTVLAAIMTLAIWKGAELTAPANPAEAYDAARPEWYYLFLFRFLKFPWVSKLGELTHLGEAFGAVVVPGLLMGVLVAMPLIARIRGGHKFNCAYLWLVVIGAGALTGVALYEDRFAEAGASFRFAEEQALLDGERTVELAKEFGIPADGAGALLANDPLVQGPKLFKTYCADCHQPDSLKSLFKNPPQAPALADLADRHQVYCTDRDWIRSILTDFSGHMAALENIQASEDSPESTQLRAQGAATILSPDDGMAGWSADNKALLTDPENAADLDAIVEFLYAQGGHADAIAIDDPKYLRGLDMFENGTLTKETLTGGCADCHNLKVRGVEDPVFDYGDGPDLTGYMSADWLKRFVTNPGDFYPSTDEQSGNAMPAFGEQLSEHELDMLARWLAGEYYRAD